MAVAIRRRGEEQAPCTPVLAPDGRGDRTPARKRLASLDAFRGLTILGMLVVNNLALDKATPAVLTHAPWNRGVYLADLVFPWFLLIVGVAIPFSVASQRAKCVPPWRAALKVVARAAVLVALGWLVDSSIAKRPVIGLGVLQLIGLAYLVGAALYRLPVAARIAAAVVLLAGHWAALRFIPVPGLGAGVFVEQANLAQYVNDAYLRPLHLAGLMSVAPTAALVLIGTMVGDTLRGARLTSRRKLAMLLLLGVGLATAGWLWNLDLPFNKTVWSASYILYTAGLGTIVLALFYLGVDMTGTRWWVYPLVVLGANAIFAYVVPILVKVYVLQGWTWGGVMLQQVYLGHLLATYGRIGGGLLYTVSYIAVWWLVLLYMYRKGVLLRV